LFTAQRALREADDARGLGPADVFLSVLVSLSRNATGNWHLALVVMWGGILPFTSLLCYCYVYLYH